MINAHVVNGTHFPEQEMVRLFKGTCLAVRAMHTYRGPPGQPGQAASNPAQSSRRTERHSEEDERFPHPETDGEEGYSYDNSVNVPLITRERPDDDDTAFHGDHNSQLNQNSDPRKSEATPYAHRDLKPGSV